MKMKVGRARQNSIMKQESETMRRFLVRAVVAIVLVGGLVILVKKASAVDDPATQARDYKGYETWILKYGVNTKTPIDPDYLKANKAYEEALAKHDKTALAALLRDDFQWTEWNGAHHTKQEVLNDFDGFIKVNNPEDDMDDRTTDFLGDSERVFGMHHSLRFLHVWIHGSNGWQAFLYTDVPIPRERREDVNPTNPPKDLNSVCPNPCGGIPESIFKPADAQQAQVLKNWVDMKISEWHPNPELWSSHADIYHENLSSGGDLFFLQHVAQLSNARRLYGPHGAAPGQEVWKMYMWTYNNTVVQLDLEDPENDQPTTWKVRMFVNRGDKPSGPGSDWRLNTIAQTRIEKNMTPDEVKKYEARIGRPSF